VPVSLVALRSKVHELQQQFPAKAPLEHAQFRKWFLGCSMYPKIRLNLSKTAQDTIADTQLIGIKFIQSFLGSQSIA